MSAKTGATGGIRSVRTASSSKKLVWMPLALICSSRATSSGSPAGMGPVAACTSARTSFSPSSLVTVRGNWLLTRFTPSFMPFCSTAAAEAVLNAVFEATASPMKYCAVAGLPPVCTNCNAAIIIAMSFSFAAPLIAKLGWGKLLGYVRANGLARPPPGGFNWFGLAGLESRHTAS